MPWFLYSLTLVMYRARLGTDNSVHIYLKMYYLFCIQQAFLLWIYNMQNKFEPECLQDEMNITCSMHGKDRKCIKYCGEKKNSRKQATLETLA
jgi:hypothetical protein